MPARLRRRNRLGSNLQHSQGNEGFHSCNGAIGLAVIEALAASKCSMIIAVDTNPENEADARAWGATHFINSKVIYSPGSVLYYRIPNDSKQRGRALPEAV